MRHFQKENQLGATRVSDLESTFVAERNLIDITLSQVGKLPSGLQVYPSWLYNSFKISNYIKKAKVYVPRVKCQLFLGNLCLFYMFQILKSIIHKNYDHKPFMDHSLVLVKRIV